MKLQIIKGHEAPRIKKFTTAKGKEMILYEQSYYAHKGGAFPEEFQISHSTAAEVLPVGEYKLCPTSFVKDNFGAISLSQYDTKLIPFLDSKF
jgi:hypothetical protein